MTEPTLGPAVAWLALLALGCSDTPTGDVRILLEAEDTVTEGLSAGAGPEDLVDGWSVSFDRYLVAIGDVRLARSGDPDATLERPEILVVDLVALGAGGTPLAGFEAVDAVRWDDFSYSTRMEEGASRHDSASQEDFDEMLAQGWTYLVEGTLSKADGESCPPGGSCRSASALSFRLGVPLDARFGPCEAEDGLPGITVTEGGTTAAVTLHGDHMFFDGFPSGAEVIERRAQWLADADLDADDHVTAEELTAADAADLFPAEIYGLSGSPFPVETGWDYLRGQLATQGHFQGEGECPWSVD